MVILICGGRTYECTQEDYEFLDTFLPCTEVVSGMAKGADLCGVQWARRNNIPVKSFYPQWNLYGKSAGFIRNRHMVDYVKQKNGIIIAFPGGPGTQHTKNYAWKKGLIIKVPK